MKRIVVIGGGYAGLAALTRIGALDRDVEVMLVEPSPVFTERIRLHEALAHGTRPTHPFASICAALDVQHVQARAEALDGRAVRIGDTWHEAEAVIVAMGSTSRPLAGAVTVDCVRHAHRLGEVLRGEVEVVGSGLTGIETATELAAARPDLAVSLVRRSAGWEGFSDRACRALDRRFDDLGIAVRSTSGQADHRIAAIGHVPRSLPGLPGSADGRVPVGPHLEVGPGLFVAGDLARTPADHPTGCVSAMPMGCVAGENAVRHLRREALRMFDLDRPLLAVGLGPGAGLVQGLRHGQPGWVLTGWPGSVVKAGILRYTTAVMAAERWARRPLYHWPGAA